MEPKKASGQMQRLASRPLVLLALVASLLAVTTAVTGAGPTLDLLRRSGGPPAPADSPTGAGGARVPQALIAWLDSGPPGRLLAQGGPTLSASPLSIGPGGIETAIWSGISNPTAGDWIGLYAAGAADTDREYGYILTGGTASGSAGYQLPSTLAAGTYELRLFANYSWTRLAVSNSFTVPTLSASPLSMGPGGIETATWSGISNPQAGDWIGLYAAGAPDSPQTYGYILTGGTASGTAGYQLPSTLPPGTYELRLFANSSWLRLAVSNAFTVPSLSASPTGNVPGAVETATWSGISNPQAGDWIGLYATGAADTDREYGYILTGGTASGSAGYQLPLNLAGGTYELRLFANYSWTRLAVSNAFTIASLAAAPATVDAGQIEIASWSNVPNPQAGDWIGLYASGAADTDREYGYILTGGTASGTAGYQLPSTLAAGTYELRLFANYSWTRLAVSNSFTVPTLSASPLSMGPGGIETATWSGISNPQAGDWIGLYAAGAPDSPQTYGYILTGGTASGTAGYQLPSTLPPGTYELRLFANSSWLRLAVSNAFTVPSLSASPTGNVPGAVETATWSGISNPQAGDWIGLYATGAADTDREYGYILTGGTASGSAGYQLPLNLAGGTYELRLFANYSWTRLAVSNAFTIASLAAAPATVDAGQIEIASWSNVPNPQAGDWIGLYASGAADTDREYGYIYTGGTASGSAGYQLPTDLPSGTYELRLFANGTWSRVAVSNAFTVTGLPVEPPPAGTDHNPPLINAETGGSGVNTYTGAYSYSHTDVAIAGRGPAPQFTRAYNSNDTRVGPLGPGWTHSYAMRLVRPASGSTSIVLVGPQGRSDTYTRQADGSYAPPAGVFATLAANTNGTYTVTAKDLTVWTFDPLGHLGSISDRYGNTAFLGYDGSGHLTSISDPAGRGSLSLDYYANGRLKTVTDWASPARVVTYGYDANGRLNSVLDRQNALLPSPQPLTSYGYDASGRLSALTNPNGHTLLSITYDPTSGRVASQYDALGSSNLTTFGYNNGVTTVTQPSTTFDGAHPTTTDTYNASGWLISRVVAPSANASETMTTSYGYDASATARRAPTASATRRPTATMWTTAARPLPAAAATSPARSSPRSAYRPARVRPW